MKRRRRCAPSIKAAVGFGGFRFPPDVIVLAVRWYLRFGLSYRDLEEFLAERGVHVDHVTLFRRDATLHAVARRRRATVPARGRGAVIGRRRLRQSLRRLALRRPGCGRARPGYRGDEAVAEVEVREESEVAVSVVPVAGGEVVAESRCSLRYSFGVE